MQPPESLEMSLGLLPEGRRRYGCVLERLPPGLDLLHVPIRAVRAVLTHGDGEWSELGRNEHLLNVAEGWRKQRGEMGTS